MLPIYSNANQTNISKLHKILITAARAAIGSYCFKKSIRYILNKCNWFDIEDMILLSSLNTIHKTIANKKPPCLLQYFKSNNRERKGQTTANKYIPTSVKFKNFYIYKYTKIYNKITHDVRSKKVKGFKKEIKLMVKAGTISDTMD